MGHPLSLLRLCRHINILCMLQPRALGNVVRHGPASLTSNLQAQQCHNSTLTE
jgi:hypothetical protein